MLPFAAHAQKQLPASRTDEAITIDGKLTEQSWQQAATATDFTQISPNPGNPASLPSEVSVLYDDGALYIGAMLYDPSPDSILKELTLRDNLGNNDYFGVLLNPYRDGINGTGFRVTAAGVQLDDKFSTLGEDPSFDLVWESEISITDNGWVVEMRIPYSAIRFSSNEVQEWSINFARYIRRIREESWWNEVKPTVQGLLTQTGTLTGLEGIVAPVRLSVAPYLSGYYDINTNPNQQEVITDTRFNGGMDLKYGINEAFTLDMTLVPDFGQVEFDEQVLNLSPFEVQFEERRQFFTEGIELFNRGGIFYSRRIGDGPLRQDELEGQLGANDSIIRNPGRSQLINATKISGRNNNNLGIGFFNAVEDRMHATVENGNGEEREVPTNPLTNYNVMVLDQGLPNNSYVSLINTNVWREGAAYNANVTATEFELRNSANRYSVFGRANLSQKYGQQYDQPELGLSYELNAGKISGNFQFNYFYYVADHLYDPNDLGFLNNNNERNTGISLTYNIYEPKGKLLRMENNLTINYDRLYQPNALEAFGITYNNFTTFTSFHSVGGNISTYPLGYNDYFDPRTPGYHYHIPDNYHIDLFVSPDYRMDFVVDARAGATWYNEKGRREFSYKIAPRIRFSDQLFVIYSWAHSFYDNNIGFATKLDDRIIFGKRDQQTVEQTIDGSFIFNNKMGIQLKLRHYWSTVRYKAFYDLQKSGEVEPNNYTGTGTDGSLHNANYNAFTVDLGYTWRFAPGSDISLVWKNAIFESDNELAKNYADNISMLADYPKFNGFSIKILYYLDYLMVKNAINPGQK